MKRETLIGPMKALLMFFLFAAPAFGQATTYVYSGSPLAYTITGNYPPSLVLAYLTGYVILAQPLDPNQANQVVTPTFYDYNVLETTEPFGPPPVFTFSTAEGEITDWSVSIDAIDGTKITSTSSGDSYFKVFYYSSCATGANRTVSTCEQVTGTSTIGGVWETQGILQPPPHVMAAAPQPSLQPQLDAANAQITTLQKQLTHVTSEMTVYRNGVVNWEAQALAWQARAYYWCKAAKGSC
jgi:hypothetical protein